MAIDLLDHVDTYRQRGYPADASTTAKEKAFTIAIKGGLSEHDVAYSDWSVPDTMRMEDEAKKAYYGKALLEIVRQRMRLRSSNHMNLPDYFQHERMNGS